MADTNQSPPAWMRVPLLTVSEVAEWAKVSTKTVYRWIEDGRLEALRFGKHTYRSRLSGSFRRSRGSPQVGEVGRVGGVRESKKS